MRFECIIHSQQLTVQKFVEFPSKILHLAIVRELCTVELQASGNAKLVTKVVTKLAHIRYRSWLGLNLLAKTTKSYERQDISFSSYNSLLNISVIYWFIKEDVFSWLDLSVRRVSSMLQLAKTLWLRYFIDSTSQIIKLQQNSNTSKAS